MDRIYTIVPMLLAVIVAAYIFGKALMKSKVAAPIDDEDDDDE